MLNEKLRRFLTVFCLTVMSVSILSALVLASPDTYISHPTDHDIMDLTVTVPTNMYDGDTTTKSFTSYARSGGYGGPGWVQVEAFDGSLPVGAAISSVKIVIYYKSTLSSSDATYQISYLIGTSETVIRAHARDMVDYTTTPWEYDAGASLTWDDVSKMSVRFTTADGRGGDTGGMLQLHEFWLDITYTPVELHVHPPSQTVDTSFTAKINVTGVVDLYGWEFKLYYDTTIFTATGVTEGTFFTGAGKSTYFKVIELNDAYSSTQGRVWATCTITGDVTGVAGQGTLATVSFDLDGPAGTSPLDLQDTKLVGYDYTAKEIFQILHTANDGEATVEALPEFPAGLALEIAVIPLIVYIFLKSRRKTKYPKIH